MRSALLLVLLAICFSVGTCSRSLALTSKLVRVQSGETALGSEPQEFFGVFAGIQNYFATQQVITENENFRYIAPDGNRIVVSHNWPKNVLDVSLWIGYGIYLVLVFISALIVMVFLCNFAFYFWCCRKCKLCGGSQPQDTGYPKKSRRLLLIPIDIIFIAIVLLTVLAIIFSALFSGGVDKVIANTFSVTDTVIGNVDRIANFTTGIAPKINSTFDKAEEIFTYLPQFNGPLNNIKSDVNTAVAELDTIKDNLRYMENSTTTAREKIYWLQRQPGLEGVPPISDIPSPSGDNYDKIDTAKQQLSSTADSVSSTQDLLSNSTEKFRGPLNNAKNTVINQALPAIDQISQPLKQVQEFRNTTFTVAVQDQIKYYVNMAEKIRVTITCVLVAWAMILYAIMLLVVYPCKKETKCCFQATACLTFFTAWIPFVIASVSFVVWAFGTDICRSAEPTAYNVLNATGISFQNRTVASMASDVLTCSGNQNLLGVIGLSLNDTLNLNKYQNELDNNLQNGLSQFSINGTLQSARDNLRQFNNQTNLVSLDYSIEIQRAKGAIGNLTIQLEDLSRFNFSMVNYDNSLISLNELTLNITNGTESWSKQNVTELNPDLPPYSDRRNEVKDRKDIVIAYQTAFNATMERIELIRYNLTIVNQSLDEISSNLTAAMNVQDRLANYYPVLINSRIDDMGVLANQLTTNVSNIAAGILGIVNEGIGAVENLLGCGYIGTNYQSTKHELCVNMLGYMGITSLCLAFIGILMFVMFPLLIVGTKYFGYKGDKYKSQPSSPMSGDNVELQEEDKGQHVTTHYPLTPDVDTE